MGELVDGVPSLRETVELHGHVRVAGVGLTAVRSKRMPPADGLPSRGKMRALDRNLVGVTRQGRVRARLCGSHVRLRGGLAITLLERNLGHYAQGNRITLGCLFLGGRRTCATDQEGTRHGKGQSHMPSRDTRAGHALSFHPISLKNNGMHLRTLQTL